MFTLIARLLSSAPATRGMAQPAGIANRLKESAEARAGQDPHHAHELRQAARAYLSVVR